MKTFEQYMIEEGKLSKAIGSALISLSLVGLAPNIIASTSQKDKKEITINKNDLSKLYRAIEKAETGSFKNKWIRTTKAPKGGSSAYGPVQITKSLVEDIASRYPQFKQKHNEFISKFIKQGNQFLKYGNEPNKAGYEVKYDYGKSGDLDNHKDHVGYIKMALDLIEILLKEKKYNLKDFIERWRGENQKGDPRYYKVIIDYLS